MSAGPRLRLAAHTCFAAKRWPEPRDWIPVVQSWGLDAVQFSLDLINPLQPEAAVLAAEAGAACRAAGISVPSSFTGGQAYLSNMLLHPDPRHRAWAQHYFLQAVTISAALGARGTGGFLGALAPLRPPIEREALLGELREFAARLGAHAARAGMEYLLVELMPGPGEVPGTPAEARELLAGFNAVSPVPYRLCFDVGHACSAGSGLAGESPLDTICRWLEELIDITGCVHLQQTDGCGDRHWAFDDDHAEAGIIQPDRVLKSLRLSPLPQLDLILELNHPPEASLEAITRAWASSVDYWRAAMRAAATAH